MNKNLGAALQSLYPHADMTKDIIVQDDGNGPYIKIWNLPDAQPTDSEIDAAALDSMRAEMWALIKAERDRRQLDGGVKVGGKWYLSNDREAGRYNSIITVASALGMPGSAVIRAGWRTMDPNVTEDMTANLARDILASGFAQFAAIDDAAQAHKAAMLTSPDPASYDFSTGWPKAYGE